VKRQEARDAKTLAEPVKELDERGVLALT